MKTWLLISLLLAAASVVLSLELNYSKVVPSKLSRKPWARISGGFRASPQQYPWYVYIMAQGSGETSSCGGSILSSSWVLTAAHCTYNYLSVDLYFGAVDIYDMPVILTSTYWIEHSSYSPSTYNNDISVIQLPSPLSFNAAIQPIRLLSLSQAAGDFVGSFSTVMGFGYTSDSNPSESPDLLYTNVVVITNSQCSNYYGPNIVTAKTLCATGAQSTVQSICSGDSGGPMVVSNGNGQYIQIGINSFVSGTGCTTGLPSGYVRLGAYLSWINSQTGVPISS